MSKYILAKFVLSGIEVIIICIKVFASILRDSDEIWNLIC